MAGVGEAALIVSAIAAVAGAATSAVTADQAANRARQGRRVQDKAQKDSAAAAAAELRRGEEANRAANRKEPNVGDLLTAEQTQRLKGPASTLLTQPGANAALGRTSLLGS